MEIIENLSKYDKIFLNETIILLEILMEKYHIKPFINTKMMKRDDNR